MAFALVGSLGAVASGNNPAPAFGQATTAGNLLICWGKDIDATISGTGWTLIGTSQAYPIWYRMNCGAAEAAPTFSGGTVSGVVMLGEFSGGATSSALDQQAEGTNSGLSPRDVTNPGADATSAELLICVLSCGLSKAGTHTSSISYNNGATNLGGANNDATSTTAHYRFSYGITTGNSAADVATLTSTSMNISTLWGHLASFKLPPAAAYAPPFQAQVRPTIYQL